MTTADLGVPLVPCNYHRPDCGPACAQMVLTYFQIPSTLEEVIGQLPLTHYGIDIMNLGIFLSRKGLHMRLFFDRSNLGPSNTTYERLLAEFIESGGEIEWRQIEYVHIENAIVDRRPVILLIPKETSPSAGHYVVAHRINETGIMFNDPGSSRVKRESTRKLIAESKKRGGLGLISGPPRNHDMQDILLTA